MTNVDWVLLARLRRPQGRKGEILADILTDFPERFADRKRLFLLPGVRSSEFTPREVALEDHWLHKGAIVLKFSGVDSINDAELLRGMDVAIPRNERAPLAEDEVYIDDLVGCSLIDLRSGRPEPVGTVTNVDRETSATPLLVVRRGDEDLLVPFAKAYLRRLDVEGKCIEMILPEGLLELNAPLTSDELREREQQDKESVIAGKNPDAL